MSVTHEVLEESSSFSSTHDYKHDVFLSFRGPDTRNKFTDHLYKALIFANLTTFLDDDDIDTGQDLKQELEEAIKESRASIIVLSENYAFSTWCLDELALILQQRRTSGHVVIPIFFHVQPTDIRQQKNSFKDAMEKHKQKMEKETNEANRSRWAEKMEIWKQALTDVSNIAGMEATMRLETELISDILAYICRQLVLPLRSTRPHLIGMDGYIKFVTLWLKDESSHTGDILTIVGMGGSGKTSLAKYVFNSHCHSTFHISRFIEDIGKKCAHQQSNGLVDLQRNLCAYISKTSLNQLENGYEYTSRIGNALYQKKAFLVLDGIDRLEQLKALLGNTGLHPGSKIIITTKDETLTQKCELLIKSRVKPKHIQLLLGCLGETESLELLCSHAFNCKNPKEGYKEVSKMLVEYCQGLPYALEVLGDSLCNQDVAYWEGCIEVLKKETNCKIREKLQICFDSLSSEMDKELFKHIACFFVGKDRVSTKAILDACDIQTANGITNLINRCLLRIGGDNELIMHQLLQKMGRDVVRKESLDKPWKRSRLWCNEESFKVLKKHKGKGNVLGLAFDKRMLEKGKPHETFELETNALIKMDNLQLLQLNYVQLNGSYKHFPEELRWLCMQGFPLAYIPLDLPMENLVALDLSNSDFESFDMSCSNPQLLGETHNLTQSFSKVKRHTSLKILNLSFCNQLRTLRGFLALPALERLILANCKALDEVCESIKQCDKLVLVDLSYCNRFRKILKTMGNLKKLETLLLNGCNLGEHPIEEMTDTNLPEMVNDLSINSQTSSSRIVEAIPKDFMSFGISLPSSLACLSLKGNDLSNESVPMDFSKLSTLKEFYLDGKSIVSLPNSCVRSLDSLEKLSTYKDHMLKTFEDPQCTLKHLIFDNWHSLQKIVFDRFPITFSMNPWWTSYSCCVIEGMLKVEAMSRVPEEVLHSLGWTNLEKVDACHLKRSCQQFEVQMVYEFGIFSTTYGGEEIPNWISDRRRGSSISFTMPSSPNNLRGINFCYVFVAPHPYYHYLPRIRISNRTKGRTWIYDRYSTYHVMPDAESCEILLSHWMFGKDEMEDGDEVTITILKEILCVTNNTKDVIIKECGVKLEYDDGKMEEDPLDYYKSWNHIIGGDLDAFLTNTGEYLLDGRRFFCPTGFGGCEHYIMQNTGLSFSPRKSTTQMVA